MEMPEAGGSIRVGRPMEIPADSSAKDETERFKAKVIDVVRGQFPETTLKLRVVGTARSPDMQKKLKKLTYVTGKVAVGYKNNSIDLAHPLTQHNLAAHYLKTGDEVIVHITEVKATPGTYLIDFIERQ